ncbi:MAG: hypothetical protein VKN33_03800 [Candidatus Sericytochromatia bacterium]|nr:hypothetical protein [Candidatus Sericytochromatia bacterium]
MTHPQEKILAFEAQRRSQSLTGQMLGIDLPARDALLGSIVADFEPQLAKARTDAATSGQPVPIEGAALSLTDADDIWWVQPDGQVEREYRKFPGYEACFAQAAGPPPPGQKRPVSDEKVLQACYSAFWAPSATNWQPTRILECSHSEKKAVSDVLGLETDLFHLPWLLTLRRDRYESLLGDVLEPFGLHVTAREESIDAGIFAHTLRLALLSEGLTLEETPFQAETRRHLTHAVIQMVTRRRDGCPKGTPERTAAEELLEDLHAARYIPDSLFIIGWPEKESPKWGRLQALISAHSTQRVASPTRKIDPAVLDKIWQVAYESVPEDERDRIEWANFSSHSKVPAQMGQAMHEALYGGSCRPGLLEAMTLRNFLLHLQQRAPGSWSKRLPAHWHTLTEKELRTVCKQLPVMTTWLGRHLLLRLGRDGRYRALDEWVVDEKERPLSLPALVRLLKGLAGTFGQHFLRFHDTHPQNSVILAQTRITDSHLTWRTVGRVAAALTWLARAEGLSSIVKTGPIDLAGSAIATILATNPDHSPSLAALGHRLENGDSVPALTFQLGYPLGGSEWVNSGSGEPHTGLEERRRDRRPPRAPFSLHYWAAGLVRE